ncbi:MAG: M48 family metallopeptidase [Planctomycetes bacterium]|nr:M48 family metallopeptidase [Planctomycetota bacterium]
MTADGEERELAIDGGSIGYTLIRSGRRTLEIAVLPGGRVEVRAPNRASIERVEDRMRARSAWLRRKVADRSPRLHEVEPRRWQSGESVRYLGRQYRLQVIGGDSSEVRVVGGRLRVVVPDGGGQRTVEPLVQGWFRARAHEVIRRRLRELLGKPAAKGLQPVAVRVRAMKNRWGSCSAAGRLTFHSRVVALKSSLLEYVIAHELCHLRIRSHGVRFERLLSRLLPDWRERHRVLAREETPACTSATGSR